VIDIEYSVRVHTGDKFGAGTDSNVFIILYGEKGETSERALTDSDNSKKFEQDVVSYSQIQ